MLRPGLSREYDLSLLGERDLTGERERETSRGVRERVRVRPREEERGILEE